MKYKEFLEYLENHLEGYNVFMEKAMQFQREKDAKRPPKNRWNDEKLEKAAADMWRASMQALHTNLKKTIDSDSDYIWKEYIEKNGILESVNDGISELDFSNDGA